MLTEVISVDGKKYEVVKQDSNGLVDAANQAAAVSGREVRHVATIPMALLTKFRHERGWNPFRLTDDQYNEILRYMRAQMPYLVNKNARHPRWRL